ncbi:MAG: hypothetical protein GYB36_12850 [Alphaproteobacteria bacterium]|nr:hypothetical protein [Alphaproteobacteria bacterium]
MSLRPDFNRLANLCFVLSWLTLRWPVFVVAISLVSPVSPHYRLTAAEGHSCAYGGVRGIIYEYRHEPCPLIALLDTRGRGQW